MFRCMPAMTLLSHLQVIPSIPFFLFTAPVRSGVKRSKQFVLSVEPMATVLCMMCELPWVIKWRVAHAGALLFAQPPHWFPDRPVSSAFFMRHKAVHVEDLQSAVVVGLDKPNDSEEVDVTDSCYLFQNCIDRPLPASVCKHVHEGQ